MMWENTLYNKNSISVEWKGCKTKLFAQLKEFFEFFGFMDDTVNILLKYLK